MTREEGIDKLRIGVGIVMNEHARSWTQRGLVFRVDEIRSWGVVCSVPIEAIDNNPHCEFPQGYRAPYRATWLEIDCVVPAEVQR